MSAPGKKINSPPSSERIGQIFFGTPYRLRFGLWVVGRDLGQPFSAHDAAVALEDTSARNPVETIHRIIPPFIDTGMVEIHSAGKMHQNKKWARLDSPIWRIFVAAGEALEIEYSPPPPQDENFTVAQASELLGLTVQAVRNREYTIVSDSRPMRLSRQEVVADFVQTVLGKEAELAVLRDAASNFGIEIEQSNQPEV